MRWQRLIAAIPHRQGEHVSGRTSAAVQPTAVRTKEDAVELLVARVGARQLAHNSVVAFACAAIEKVPLRAGARWREVPRHALHVSLTRVQRSGGISEEKVAVFVARWRVLPRAGVATASLGVKRFCPCQIEKEGLARIVWLPAQRACRYQTPMRNRGSREGPRRLRWQQMGLLLVRRRSGGRQRLACVGAPL